MQDGHTATIFQPMCQTQLLALDHHHQGRGSSSSSYQAVCVLLASGAAVEGQVLECRNLPELGQWRVHENKRFQVLCCTLLVEPAAVHLVVVC